MISKANRDVKYRIYSYFLGEFLFCVAREHVHSELQLVQWLLNDTSWYLETAFYPKTGEMKNTLETERLRDAFFWSCRQYCQGWWCCCWGLSPVHLSSLIYRIPTVPWSRTWVSYTFPHRNSISCLSLASPGRIHMAQRNYSPGALVQIVEQST